MAKTYDSIATYTFTGSGTSYTFSSIPGTYTDLVLILELSRNLSGAGDRDAFIRFNSDSGSNYSRTRMYQGGSDRNSNSTSLQLCGAGDLAVTRTLSRVQIQNYANTSAYKAAVTRWGHADANGQVFAGVGLWRSNSAINSIQVFETVDGFAAGDSLTLYGIKAA